MIEKKGISSRTALSTAIVVAVGAAALTCVCGLAALFLLRRVESLPGGIALWRPTAVQPTSTAKALPPAPPVSATPTQAQPQPPGAAATPTATHTPAPTTTPRQWPTPRPTYTLPPLDTPVPTWTPTAVAATPTPFVCEGLTDLANMRLAPGQRFECTVRQETLTALATSYEDSPCSETRFTLDNGEIRVECRMGVTMSATLAVRAQGCRIALQVLKGTMGFKNVVQELIETQFNAIRYDDICMEQIVVDDGRISVSGYGR
jgi:hypothetical protein